MRRPPGLHRVLARTVITRWCPAEVDDAEGVAVWVGEDHEVWFRRIQVPIEPACPKFDEPFDCGFLLGGAVDEQVEVQARVCLDGGLAALQAQRSAGTVSVVQRHPVVALPLVGGHQVERGGPEGNGARHVDHTDHRDPESEHDLEA